MHLFSCLCFCGRAAKMWFCAAEPHAQIQLRHSGNKKNACINVLRYNSNHLQQCSHQCKIEKISDQSLKLNFHIKKIVKFSKKNEEKGRKIRKTYHGRISTPSSNMFIINISYTCHISLMRPLFEIFVRYLQRINTWNFTEISDYVWWRHSRWGNRSFSLRWAEFYWNFLHKLRRPSCQKRSRPHREVSRHSPEFKFQKMTVRKPFTFEAQDILAFSFGILKRSEYIILHFLTGVNLTRHDIYVSPRGIFP